MITYTDKVSVVSNPLPDINKVTDTDMNQIKSVVNTNETALGTKVPDSRILTIDGVPFDLSADRSWTTAAGPDKFPNIYNVTHYGLVGDGATDNSSAITTLIASVSAGSWLYFPLGDFRFNTGITFDKHINLCGAGHGSIIGTTANITLLDYNSGAQIPDVNIRNLRIRNHSLTTPTSSSIGLKSTVSSERWRFFNIRISGFYKNIQLESPTEYVIDTIYCDSFVNTGLEMISIAPHIDSGDGSIINSYFIPADYDSVYSIFHQNGGGLKITNTKFNYQGGATPHKANYHYYYNGTGGTVDFHMSNCSLENWAVTAIRMGVSGSGSFRDVTIVGNDIGGTSSAGSDGIEMFGIQDGCIVGNAMRATGSGTMDAIRLTNCENFVILNEYQNWSNNVLNSGSTNIFTPIQASTFISPSNDDILQRKSGVWTNRTIAQLITDLVAGGMTGTGDVVGPGSATAGAPVVFDGTTGKLIKQGNTLVDWSASLAEDGWSGTPSTLVSRYYDDGVRIHIFVVISGTSDSTLCSFQLPVAPNAAYGTAGLMTVCHIQNSSTGAVGRAYASGGATTVTVDRDQAGTAWTASGVKTVRVSFLYFK